MVGRFRVLEDDDDNGLAIGDEGELSACVVGLEKHDNERIFFGLKIDGMIDPNEVTDLLMLEPI